MNLCSADIALKLDLLLKDLLSELGDKERFKEPTELKYLSASLFVTKASLAGFVYNQAHCSPLALMTWFCLTFITLGGKIFSVSRCLATNISSHLLVYRNVLSAPPDVLSKLLLKVFHREHEVVISCFID